MRLGERDFVSSLKRTLKAVFPAQSAPYWADDLLRIARAAYLVDKRVLRAQESSDGWTRDIHLSVQVTSAERWEGQPLEVLNAMLRVLTADIWQVTVTSGAPPIDAQPRLGEHGTAEVIALFSGGLDSTGYAASHANEPGGPLWLIGHDFAHGHAPQRHLYHAIRDLDGRQRPVEWCPVSDIPAHTTRATQLEPSTRSRGFLFAVTAVYAAAAHGVREVAMPENGQLAINPPLSPDRRAACSTRSVHPWVLNHLNQVITLVGGDVTVHNPFLYKTKGEVCRIARDSGLTKTDLACTVSCANHPANRKAKGNCGYCYPCLIRRSGLNAALGGDPTVYENDLRTLTPRTAQHLRDLQRWMAHEFRIRDLTADMPLPGSVSRRGIFDMLSRGRREIADMLVHNDLWVNPARRW